MKPFPCCGATFTQAQGQCEMELMDGMGSCKSRSWQKTWVRTSLGEKRVYSFGYCQGSWGEKKIRQVDITSMLSK